MWFAALTLAQEDNSLADTDSSVEPKSITESLMDFWYGLIDHLPQLGVGLLVLVGTWIVAIIGSRLVKLALRKTRLRNSLKSLFSKLTVVGIWVAGILATCMVVFPTLTPGRLLATLGLGSIAIGFAFKDIFENFFAGILILWRFPFENGDYIACEGIEGKVEEVNIRQTLIRQVDGQLVVVPNGAIFKNPTRVLTSRDVRRTTIICGVAYGEDVDACRQKISAAVEQCGSVSNQEPIQVFAQEFADSSVNFEVTWWTGSTPLDIRQSRDEVIASIKRTLDEADIEIPFPYRTLTFNDPVAIRQSEERSVQD